MDNKLERFFNKIGFNEIDDFKDSKVIKVLVNKLEETWTVYIENNSYINPINTIKLINICSRGIDGVSKINIKYKNNNIKDNDILEYFKYLLNELVDNRPSISSIINNNIYVNNNIIVIEVSSNVEEDLIKKEKNSIIKKLNELGYINIDIESKLNLELKEEVKKDINESRKEVKIEKKENPIIMGEEIKTKVTTIDSIMGEDNNTCVEAYVFGSEVFESSKSNFKILTLKISDKTDSILAKIFSRDEDEFKSISKKIKNGNWYKFRGYIKNDQYAHDMVLNIRDITSIPSKDVSVIDDSEEKRIELHAHTMMSQMDGCVDAKKLLKTVTSWGHKTIGITDHNGCQSFPDVYHFVTDYNKGKEDKDKFKAIYGCELTLVDDTIKIVTRERDYDLLNTTYCVFDLETTGFNARDNSKVSITVFSNFPKLYFLYAISKNDVSNLALCATIG